MMARSAWNGKAKTQPAELAFPELKAPAPQNQSSAIVPRSKRNFKALYPGNSTQCLRCGKACAGRGPCSGCGYSSAPQLFCWTGSSWNGDKRGYLPASDPTADEYNRSFQEACRLKNNLLRYQEEEVKRTRVLDDSCDWYDLADNPWLSKEERDAAAHRARKLRDEEQKLKRHVFVDIDFPAGLVTDCTSKAASRRAEKDKHDLRVFLDGSR